MSNDTIEHDPFAGSSGLADDIDVTFTECRFVRDPGYKDNDTGELIPVFAVDLVTDDPDAGTDGTIENQFLSIGKGWDIEDNGAKVVRAEGKKGGFNNSSYLQIVVARLLELDEAAVRGRYEQTGLTPQEAGYWEGLRCHMVQEEYTTGGFKNVAKQTRSRLMPTEVYGWDEAEDKPKPAAKKATAKKAPAKKPPAKKVEAAEPEGEAAEAAEPQSAYQGALAQVDAEMVAAIEAIAAEADTAEEFIDRCYAEVDGLGDDENAMAVVDDVDSDDSIWATAVAAAG